MAVTEPVALTMSKQETYVLVTIMDAVQLVEDEDSEEEEEDAVLDDVALLVGSVVGVGELLAVGCPSLPMVIAGNPGIGGGTGGG